MSAPGWPSVQDYIAWAQSQGCGVETVEIVRDERLLHAVTIRAPSGASVTEIVAEMDDPLMSTTVARLDRRLSLKSRFFR